MSKSIFGIILTLLVSLPLKAEKPTFNIGSTEATNGQIINIDFHVDDFTDIISAQFSVNWNPAVLKFRAIKNHNASVPGLSSPSAYNTTPAFVDAGVFTLVWIESGINPITIPDGSLFFTVEFEVLGTPCQQSTVAITDDPLEIEVAEVGEVSVGLNSNNGLVNVPGTGCEADIMLIGNSVIGACNGNACIQFTVENFITVGAMEFSLFFDPAVLQFTEFKNFAPLLGFGSGNTNLLAPGKLRILWFNGNVENDTLPDGTILFEICFNVIGGGGQSSEITLGNDPPVMISDIDGNLHMVGITPASITAQCQLEGFALIADTVCTTPGGMACFDIKVHDFDEIIAFQYSMNWNKNLFTFDHVENFGIPGLDAQGFGTPGFPDVDEGELTVSWIDLSLDGVTLPDFTTIYTVCLNAVGAAGTSSPFTFSSNPLEIEIATIDSTLEYTLVQGLGQIRVSCIGCQVSYTLTQTPPTCPREENASLNLEVMENCAETPTYLWSNNATTQDLTGIGAGTYTVTITVGSQVVVVTEIVNDPPPLAVTGEIFNPVPISGNNGSINLTVTGGTPPYTFQWSTPPGSTTEDISNLTSGAYTVTVTDKNGCSFIPDTYIVGAEVAAAVKNVSCPGGIDGGINLSVSFGTGPYTFVWNTVPPQTTEDLTNLKAGQYCVTITASGGSTRDTCFTVTQPAPLVVTASIAHDVNEDCKGAIDMNVTGGVMPYTYLWSTGATTQDITMRCGGEYCVTISYGIGCTFDTCFVIAAGGMNISLAAKQYGSFQTSCNGVCDGQITSTIVGGVAPYTYLWSHGPTTSDVSSLCAGTYTVTVTDASGMTATANRVIASPGAITMSFITTNPSDYISSDGAIAVVVNGGTPPYLYLWTGPVSGTTASLNDIRAGTYSMLIVDATGCEARASQVLQPTINVPCNTAIKVITPNGDGKNDFFIISCVFDFESRLHIFNRFGGLVYETGDYQNDWSGEDQNGEPLPDGGYLWVLEMVRQDGSTQLAKGTVNVVRTAD